MNTNVKETLKFISASKSRYEDMLSFTGFCMQPRVLSRRTNFHKEINFASHVLDEAKTTHFDL